MDKDRMSGKVKDVAGRVKRQAGEWTGDEKLQGDDKKEAERNNKAARLWISGLESVQRKLGLARIIDLPPRSSSRARATPRGRCSPGR